MIEHTAGAEKHKQDHEHNSFAAHQRAKFIRLKAARRNYFYTHLTFFNVKTKDFAR
jgi:hypothetical protein